MSKIRQSERNFNPQKTMRFGIFVGLALLLVYTYFDLASYLDSGWLKALPQPWADNVIYCLIILAAIPAAGMGLLLARMFKPHEPQRRIWLFFSLGWTCWVLGEISGFLLRQIYSTLPDITISDLFWSAGYIFFGLSIYYQYLLLYVRGNIYGGVRQARLGFIAAIGHVLLIPLIITAFLRQAGFDSQAVWASTYLNILYPTCDLIVGIAALWYSFIFRRGVLGRPWLGLLAFAVSDGISGWYWIGGYKLLTPSSDTTLSVMTDILYIGGYIFTALACLSLYLLIKYGSGSPDQKSPSGNPPVTPAPR
jgi:hypothetical protein